MNKLCAVNKLNNWTPEEFKQKLKTFNVVFTYMNKYITVEDETQFDAKDTDEVAEGV